MSFETFKVEAAYSVLTRLGDQMFAILKEELANSYNIRLTAGAGFALDELHAALRDLVGEGAAKWLIFEIHAEIDYLSNEHLATAENMVLTERTS